jgi:hypothetical protein
MGGLNCCRSCVTVDLLGIGMFEWIVAIHRSHSSCGLIAPAQG